MEHPDDETDPSPVVRSHVDPRLVFTATVLFALLVAWVVLLRVVH